MSDYWTCAQVQPLQENRAIINLRRQGFEDTFYPFYSIKTKHNNNLSKALFPGYIFIKIVHGQSWSPISNTYGITRLLTCCGSTGDKIPAQISNEFISSISKYNANDMRGEIPINTRVKVINGALLNHQAIVKWSTHERVGLLFAILGRSIIVEFSIEDVEEVLEDGN